MLLLYALKYPWNQSKNIYFLRRMDGNVDQSKWNSEWNNLLGWSFPPLVIPPSSGYKWINWRNIQKTCFFSPSTMLLFVISCKNHQKNIVPSLTLLSPEEEDWPKRWLLRGLKLYTKNYFIRNLWFSLFLGCFWINPTMHSTIPPPIQKIFLIYILYFWNKSSKAREAKIYSILFFGNRNSLAPEQT